MRVDTSQISQINWAYFNSVLSRIIKKELLFSIAAQK